MSFRPAPKRHQGEDMSAAEIVCALVAMLAVCYLIFCTGGLR